MRILSSPRSFRTRAETIRRLFHASRRENGRRSGREGPLTFDFFLFQARRIWNGSFVHFPFYLVRPRRRPRELLKSLVASTGRNFFNSRCLKLLQTKVDAAATLAAPRRAEFHETGGKMKFPPGISRKKTRAGIISPARSRSRHFPPEPGDVSQFARDTNKCSGCLLLR